jgi:bifunctional non-homologous end joining protein LigD
MPPQSTPFIQPLELSEQEKPPSGDVWVHEIKWDGYRVQAHLQGGKAIFVEAAEHLAFVPRTAPV